jgi:hypothetical protein
MGDIAIDERRRLFSYRKRVREVTRAAWIECEGNPEQTQQMAEQEVKSVIGSIILAIIVSLVSEWIADFIRDWLARGIKIPSQAYHPGEPGYLPEFEDDES